MGEAQTPPGGYGRNLQPDRYTKVQHKSTHSVIPAVPTLKLANLRGLLGVVLLLRHCLLVSVVMICTFPNISEPKVPLPIRLWVHHRQLPGPRGLNLQQQQTASENSNLKNYWLVPGSKISIKG